MYLLLNSSPSFLLILFFYLHFFIKINKINKIKKKEKDSLILKGAMHLKNMLSIESKYSHTY